MLTSDDLTLQSGDSLQGLFVEAVRAGSTTLIVNEGINPDGIRATQWCFYHPETGATMAECVCEVSLRHMLLTSRAGLPEFPENPGEELLVALLPDLETGRRYWGSSVDVDGQHVRWILVVTVWSDTCGLVANVRRPH